MKRLMLILSLVVGFILQSNAQLGPCDITSGGIGLLNATATNTATNLFVGGAIGNARFVMRNAGAGQNNGDPCAYEVGVVKIKVTFPRSVSASYFFRYDGGSSPLVTANGRYSFTYNSATSTLEGVNLVPIPSDLAFAEIVDVPIVGINPGVTLLSLSMQIVNSASGDNTNNNAFAMPVTVLTPSGGTLPVKLESIDGSGDKCNAQLRWKTTYEVNLKNFEVEVSKDGVSFDKAGTINPASDLSAGSYQFNTTQSSGVTYYRLRIVEKDGSFVYSKVIPISTTCSDKVVKVFPNPVKADQLLSVNISGYKASVKGDLYSSTGQFVKSYVLKNGSNFIPVENLAQGFYTLRIIDNGTDSETFKINVLK